MDELKDLYNGFTSYSEDFGYNTSQEWKDLAQEVADLLDDLSSGLDDGQKEKLEQLKELYLKQNCLETDRMFFYAFRHGAILIMDIQNEK